MNRSSFALLIGLAIVVIVQSAHLKTNEHGSQTHQWDRSESDFDQGHPIEWLFREPKGRHSRIDSEHPAGFEGEWGPEEEPPFPVERRSSRKGKASKWEDAHPAAEGESRSEEGKKETIIHPVPVSKRGQQLKEKIAQWQPVRTEPHVEGQTTSKSTGGESKAEVDQPAPAEEQAAKVEGPAPSTSEGTAEAASATTSTVKTTTTKTTTTKKADEKESSSTAGSEDFTEPTNEWWVPGHKDSPEAQ